MSHRGLGPRHGGPGPSHGGGQFSLPPPVQAGSQYQPLHQVHAPPPQYNYYGHHHQPGYPSYLSPPPSNSAAPPPMFPSATMPPAPPPLAPPAPVIRQDSVEKSQPFQNVIDVMKSQASSTSSSGQRSRNFENSRDPRRRNSRDIDLRKSSQDPPYQKVNPYDPNAALEPHMTTIRAAVDKAIGLGIRKDIYQEVGSPMARNIVSKEAESGERTPEPVTSYHIPVDTPAESVLPSLDNSYILENEEPPDDIVQLSPDETKCDKKVLDSLEVRCNFCPEPGLIKIGEKIAHQSQHMAAFFSCAACSGKRKFEEFDELVQHIHSLHKVTDSEMVLETIILPNIENGLKMFKCGVKNCGATFSALAEASLLAHMRTEHGEYYIKLGRGKYLLRLCRICGEERPFTSDKELTEHIRTGHPADQFGEKYDSDEEPLGPKETRAVREVSLPEVKQEVEELTSNLLGQLSRPRSSQAHEPSSSLDVSTISASPEKKKKKDKKKSKPQSSSSSESESESSDEDERKKKKKKKATKGKKSIQKLTKEEKKFKKRIESYTPEELLVYLKDMKNKKKQLKEKSIAKASSSTSQPSTSKPTHAPDPNTTFSETVRGKPSHFYCLICSVYTGKIGSWLEHRASYHHIEMYSQTKEVALKRFHYNDIDMQECVVGEKKFTVDPAGQCRECLDIFWSQNDHGTHLKDGKCIKLEKEKKEKEKKEKKEREEKDKREREGRSSWAEASSSILPRISPERSPSPNIIWKPLPKAGDKGIRWKPFGGEETRSVYERSPSPDKAPAFKIQEVKDKDKDSNKPRENVRSSPLISYPQQSNSTDSRFGYNPQTIVARPDQASPTVRKRVFSETPTLRENLTSLGKNVTTITESQSSVRKTSPPRRYSKQSPARKRNLSRSPARQYSDSPILVQSRSRSRGRYSQSTSRSRSTSRRRFLRSPRRNSRSPRRYSRSRTRSRGRYSRSRSRSPRSRNFSRSPQRRFKSRSPSPSHRRGGWSSKSRGFSPKIETSPRRRRRRISRTRSRSPPRRIPALSGANTTHMVVEELSKKQREEQVREESILLNNLKRNLVTKKAVLEDDLRDKIVCKKIKMLDSRNDAVKIEKSSGTGSLICPFCIQTCKSDDDLMDHMKLRHRTDMFGCSKCASGLQPAMAWSVEVLLQHLATQHRLNVAISEAISSYVDIPTNLHRINCKLCLPPYLLGSEGFWIGSDLQQNMSNIEKHFEFAHAMTDKSQVVSKLELACRGCDATFPHTQRGEWLQHIRRNHERLNRPNVVTLGPTKRCNYCGENILQTETIRHVKEAHTNETFRCKACLEVDPACFPYHDTIKEMLQHMVMKHGDQFSSYYDHIVYPTTLYGSICSGSKCGEAGMVTAFDAATIGKHLRQHQETGGSEVGLFYCRCCDRIKEKFKVNIKSDE